MNARRPRSRPTRRIRLGTVTAAGILAGLALQACTEISTTRPQRLPIEEVDFAPELGVDLDDFTRLESGLYIEDREVGEGAEAQVPEELLVEFTGWLPDGRIIDTTRSQGDGSLPFRFTLGQGEVIAGWDAGIPGMREGGVRLLVIPPELAFGAGGSSSRGGVDIPPNSWVVFEVELVEVLAPGGA